jgi:ArsR family transcriptional regulator
MVAQAKREAAQLAAFNDEAELIGAFAHPTRLAILARLLEGVRCVNDIRDLLGVRQPNVSQHLSILRRHGLVDCRREGARRCYYLPRPDVVREMMHLARAARDEGRKLSVHR